MFPNYIYYTSYIFRLILWIYTNDNGDLEYYDTVLIVDYDSSTIVVLYFR